MLGPLVFVDIDTQRDFLEETGALYVPGSRSIVPNLERLTGYAAEPGHPGRGDRVLPLARATPSSRSSPRTAWLGPTASNALPRPIARIRWCWASAIVTTAPCPATSLSTSRSSTSSAVRMPIPSSPDTTEGNPTFVVYGVATDYCVRAAVEGLLARGYRVAVVADAVRAIDPDAEADLFRRVGRSRGRPRHDRRDLPRDGAGAAVI